MIVREAIPLSAISDDVQGLFRQPKSLPPKLFYDETGSALFERITELPEYYLTRCETAILESYANEIAATAHPLASLVELGAGTSSKTKILIRALVRRDPVLSFFPVDVSLAALRAGHVAIQREFPELRQEALVADLTEDLSFVRTIPAPRLVLYLGSSIGNFEPLEAVTLLRRVRRELRRGDALLLGTDLRKSPEILLPAYNDSKGVTESFNKNMLVRINRELGGHFELDNFRHVGRWNDRQSRMEMHLESTGHQWVPIDLLDAAIEFQRGETIHTENSYKYSQEMIQKILHVTGFALERTWTDERGWFAEHMARVA